MTDSATVDWIARLTPAGMSALATLACRGPGVWDVIRAVFRPLSGAALPAAPRTGQFWLGQLQGECTEQLILAVRATVPSHWVELHCHGGREVVHYLEQFFQTRGLVSCDWPALLAGANDDALRTAAAVALTSATTVRTASIVLDQYHGAFRAAIAGALAELHAGKTESARLTELARYAPLGRHLLSPWRVVLAGAPNVGKSSLLNALAGFQRSIVASTPGTTRDVVTTHTAFDGWPVELVDTAGLRDGAEALEEQGVSKARDTAAAADLCLWVLDASAEPVWPDPNVGAVQLVVNKIDLPCVWDLSTAAATVRVSARTGAGLDVLGRTIARWLVPEPPPAGAAVPFTPRLATAVEQAQQALQAGQSEQACEWLQLVSKGNEEMRDTFLKSGPVGG